MLGETCFSNVGSQRCGNRPQGATQVHLMTLRQLKCLACAAFVAMRRAGDRT